MIEPIYQEFAARSSLRDIVHCVWTFQAPFDDTPQPIAPDGRCELIVQCGAPYREGDGMLQAKVLFAGQTTQPLILCATGEVCVVGIRFHPEAARAFLGFPADRVTDKRVPLDIIHPGRQAERLHDQDLSQTVSRAQDYVEMRVRGFAIDCDVRDAVVAMLAEREEIPAPAELSERQWQRRFKSEVGVSPRQLQSVLRFRRVFDEIDRPERPGWVEAALAAGYFDQPQMARDFRRFLGVSARQWAAQRAGLATALAAAPETYKIG